MDLSFFPIQIFKHIRKNLSLNFKGQEKTTRRQYHHITVIENFDI